jgi:hypothetical protein
MNDILGRMWMKVVLIYFKVLPQCLAGGMKVKVKVCVGLVPQPRSPTKCLWIEKPIKEGQGPIRTVEAS